MMRERLAGLVVRAYPDGAPTGELAGIALDVGAESRARFARELAGLTRAGPARARHAHRERRSCAAGLRRPLSRRGVADDARAQRRALATNRPRHERPAARVAVDGAARRRAQPRPRRLRPRRRRRRARLVGRALPCAGRRSRLALGPRGRRRDAAAVLLCGGAVRRARRPPAATPSGRPPPRLSRRPADAAWPPSARRTTRSRRCCSRSSSSPRWRSSSSRSPRSRPTRASRSRAP